ncbi:pentapeptide repeat-containing protein [Streptosporangium sp. NPDC003464]
MEIWRPRSSWWPWRSTRPSSKPTPSRRTWQIAERNAALAEQVADNTKHDATERRVTDLYTKAAEQLGHEAAAVRLAGLYALERMAQDNPGHRQTIVNVICAYLRMPYTPPEPAPAPDPERDRTAALRVARRRYQAARAGIAPPAEPAPRQESDDREGELQVRLTAQRILTTHPHDDRPADQRSTLPAAPPSWEGMSLDLTGATLLDFDLVRSHVTDAVFDKATFHGPARFGEATFHEDARLGRATFTKGVWLDGPASAEAFDGVVVVDPAAAHAWPDGWRLRTTREGAGRLLREETDGAPPQGA